MTFPDAVKYAFVFSVGAFASILIFNPGAISFSPPLDLGQYWYALVSAAAGIYGALKISEAEAKKAEKLEKEYIKDQISKSIRKNIGLAIQARLQIAQKNSFPDYPLDSDSLYFWISRARGKLPDDALDKINEYRFQLVHVNNKCLIHPIVSVSNQT